MKAGTVAASLLVLAATVVPASAETLAWGGRAGMESTVVSKSGIDTSNAIIKTRLTEESAEAYCNYRNLETCVDQVMRERGEDVLTADCVSGKFVSFYGPRQFLGKNPEYKTGRQPGEPLPFLIRGDDGIMELGYLNRDFDIDFWLFVALCPLRVPDFGPLK